MNKVNITELKDDMQEIMMNFIRIFGTCYAGRTGLSIILRMFTLLRKGKTQKLFSLQKILSEKKVVARVEAMRIGLCLGGFVSIFNFLKLILEYYTRKRTVYHSAIAGAVASVSCLFLEKDFRRSVALYIFARFCQSMYNWLKEKGYWHFWGSDWEHGDLVLFALSSAQVMYGYVMRPETLPKSYYKFILRTGPIDEVVLEAVRKSNRNKPLPLEDIFNYIKETVPNFAGHPGYKLQSTDAIIPCSVLHPRHESHIMNFLNVVKNAARQLAPLYGTLTFLPILLFRIKKLFANPIMEIIYGIKSTFWSTAFLSTFTGLYQVVICSHRQFATVDNRFTYYIAGLVASLSLLFEKKSRRSELALYALPRALDALYITMKEKKFLGDFPKGDALLIALGMSGIMYCYDYERETLSPFIQTFLKKLLNDKTPQQKKNRKKKLKSKNNQ